MGLPDISRDVSPGNSGVVIPGKVMHFRILTFEFSYVGAVARSYWPGCCAHHTGGAGR